MAKNLQPSKVVQEVLRDVASHDNKVRQGIGEVCGRAVQPRHTVGIRLPASDLKHHRLWLDADHLVASAGQQTAKQPSPGTDVCHHSRIQTSGKFDVEAEIATE